MSAAVEVENVTKRFASTLALNDVSFTIEQGARVLIAARRALDGAGPSTSKPARPADDPPFLSCGWAPRLGARLIGELRTYVPGAQGSYGGP